MDLDKNHNGAWIFVSHSHQDMVEVRKVRNELENLGHNPLLFYLKSMEDANEQLPDLIKKEIQARNWFVLCESENSKKSDWVKKEVEIIKSLPDKVNISINLEKAIEPQIEKLKALSKRATIFLSYSRNDMALADEIYERLKAEDYRVFNDVKDLSPGSDWMKEIFSSLDEAIKHGFVLILLSPASLKSEFAINQITYALEKSADHKSNIIPIIIKDKEIVYDSILTLTSSLKTIQMLDFTTGNLQEHMTNLIAYLKNKEME